MATSRPVAPGSVARGGAAEQVGRVLGGRYRLLAPIGTGASADVFVAEDVVLRRRVAVKILHRALAEDEGFLRRFRAEAQAAAALNHPNVMKVFDSGEDGGPYLVLEYLSGGSLRDLLDAGHRLTPSQAVLIGLEAARALDYAHRRGLVHRDIKPANLLFDDEGRLRIADFGLARALAEAAWTEPAGAVLGTARYAAPEQAQAQPLDGRADVYSLALVLVEAVTGTVPFSADTTIATLMARVDKPLVAPRQLGVLGPVVEAAGTADPASRLDAADLVRSLDRVAGDLPAPAPLPIVGESRPHVLDTVAVDRTELGPVRSPSTVLADEEPPGIQVIDGEPGGPRRRWPSRVLVGALLLALALASAALTARLATPSHEVPRLVNLTFADARQRAQSNELDVARGRAVFHEEIPEGHVVRQTPVAGDELREGKAITVVLSKGPEPRTVPDLTGMTEEQARAAVEGMQLRVEVENVYSETINKGHVVDWVPKDKPVARGGMVEVVVSDGPQPRTLPDLRGQTFDEAAAKLRELGLDPKRAEVFDDEVAVGKVVGTKPGPGQQVERGAAVTINVSKGPDLITVPDVSGMDVDEAVERMEAAGFRVVDVEGPPRKDVYASDPAAGTKAKRGSEVTLYTR